jgi:hypothetical protein
VSTSFRDVTDEQFLDAIRAVVAEDPERIYERPEHMEARYEGACYYVHTDARDERKLFPGCVIGQALHRLGVPLESLRDYEGENATAVVTAFMPNVSFDARNYACTVQSRQDTANTWGDALAYADNLHK